MGCNYCQLGKPDHRDCGERFRHPDTPWICTRTKGHTGDHVACGGEVSHEMHTWPQGVAGMLQITPELAGLVGAYLDARKRQAGPADKMAATDARYAAKRIADLVAAMMEEKQP